MEFDINDLASIGVVRDVPAYQLAPEAFTLGLNVRFTDDGLESLLGWQQIFETPGVAPHFAMAVSTAAARFWLYVSLTKAYGYDGSNHTNITRQSAGVDVNYTATDTPNWNGTLLGGVPIVNNGTDVPQFWATISLATKLANLTNWPSTLRAKVVRAFGPILIALNCSKSGTAFPHLVKWSHPADPGSVPSSWDETDPTKDTGEKDLSDINAGVLMDALPLGDTMYLYKESSTWKMRYIGGRFVFDFGQSAWLPTSGILAPRCVCVTGDGLRHVVVTQEDIIWHNGNTVQSVLDKKLKKKLFSELDSGNYVRSFLFDNPLYKEVWFCYVLAGETYPTKALIMNYGTGRWAVSEADGITFRHATIGAIEAPSEETWDANEELWDDDTGSWSELLRRRVILSGTDATKFYNLDRGVTRDGTEFLTTLQRTGLALIGKKRNGEPIVDFNRMKMLKRLWAKIQGGPVTVRFASQQHVDGAVSWGSSVPFDPTTQTYCDPGPAMGRAVGFEIAGTSSNQWRMDGYKPDMEPLGNF